MIPKNITIDHIIKAIEYIDKNGVPERHNSNKYELRFNGVSRYPPLYPPKYIIAVANKIANNVKISTRGFNAVQAKDHIISLRHDSFRIYKNGKLETNQYSTNENQDNPEASIETTNSNDDDFTNIKDEREKQLAEITKRQGQPEFRKSLLQAYHGKCSITGFDVEDALEAAHIIPFYGEQSQSITNGILLRADIHTLFDLYLLSIDP